MRGALDAAEGVVVGGCIAEKRRRRGCLIVLLHGDGVRVVDRLGLGPRFRCWRVQDGRGPGRGRQWEDEEDRREGVSGRLLLRLCVRA